MIGVVIALLFLLGSIGIMISGIILNRINPNYSSALGVPVFNALGIFLALVGLGIAIFAFQKNKNLKLAKRTMILGCVCLIILMALFPFSNMGSLSIVQ